MEAAKKPKEARTRAVIFEAMFLRGMDLDDALEAELRRNGFDPKNLQVDYPNTVFIACVDAAWRLRFPSLPRGAAHWKLATFMVNGFGQTLVGKVVQAGLPMLGTMRFLKRFPSFMSIDSTDLTMTFEEVGPKHGRLLCSSESQLVPEFTAGCVERATAMTGVKPQVTLELTGPNRFNLDVRW